MSQTRLVLMLALGLALASITTLGSMAMSAAQDGKTATTQPLTFSKQIAPLIFDKCSGCHRPGGPGPFSLLTYTAVRQRAIQIAAVTKSRFMPPWKAEPGFGDFVGQHPLTDAEIDLIQHWVDEGTLEGNPEELPPLPPWPEEWQLGKPDLIVRLPQPYTLPAEGTDVFRVFVIPLPISAAQYVRGLEFRPGNPRVVHHANIRIDRTPASRELDEQDPTSGYEGGLARSTEYPEGYFPGWTPGQVDPLLPKGLAWRLDKGTDLVIQLHMRPSGKPEVVELSVGFFFGNDPPERTPAVLRLGRQSIDIPAGRRDYLITDSYVLPVDVEVQAVHPHAHYRAREIQGFATLPDGSTKWLIYIKDWDFRWQHVYRYVTPFLLPKDTTLTMRYTYDNSAENPRNPPGPLTRVRYGWRSADEMGDLWIQVLTRDDRDLSTLNREFRRKFAAEDIIGDEVAIETEPRNSALHDDVALLCLELGRHQEAIAHFEASLSLKPDSAVTHFNLGTALMLAGRFEEAITRFQEALRISPNYPVAHNNLGKALLSLDRMDEAIGHHREALRLAPNTAAAHNNLGLILMRHGDLDEALLHFRDALQIESGSADTHYNMGHALKWRGELAEAVGHFQQAVRLKPDGAPALTSLAWILATTTEETLRDANQAVRLAERAVDLTNRQEAEALDVLAAAYAAAGSFDRALTTSQEAMRLDPAGPLAAAILQRQELYRRHKPYREVSSRARTP